MAGPLSRLARFCVRFRWAAIAGWLFAVVGLAVAGGKMQVNGDVSIPGSDSQRALEGE